MATVNTIGALDSACKYLRVDKYPNLFLQKQSAIINMVKQGLSRKEIAARLGITCDTLTKNWSKLKINSALRDALLESFQRLRAGENIDEEWSLDSISYYRMLIAYDIPIATGGKGFYKGSKFDKDQAKIISLVKQGLKRGEIVKELGYSKYEFLNKVWEILDIDNAIRNELLSSKLQGKTREEIQKEWNVNQDRYYIMLRKYNVPASKAKTLLEREDEIIALRDQGKTQVEMAKALGVTLLVLRAALEKLGTNTLHIDRIQNVKKSDLIAWKQQYKGICKISEAKHIPYPTLKRLFEYFGLE